MSNPLLFSTLHAKYESESASATYTCSRTRCSSHLIFKDPGKGLSLGFSQRAAQPLQFWVSGMPTQKKTSHFTPGSRDQFEAQDPI